MTVEPTDSSAPRPWSEVRRYAHRMAAHWKVACAGLVSAAVVAVLAATVVSPLYTSQAVVIHRELIPAQTLLGRDTPEETQRQRGARLRDMVLARTNVESIVTELDLYPGERAGGGVQEAIDTFLKGADCKVVEDTFTLRVTYPDPGLAFAAAQKLAESLVRLAATSREQRARATRDFIAAQRDEAARELRRNEEVLAQFLAEHPEFAQDAAGPAGQTQAGASIRAAQRRAAADGPDVGALQQHRARLERQIHAGGSSTGEATGGDASNQEARERVSAARRELDRSANELADLRSRYTDAHPDVAAARRRNELAQRALAEADRRASVATSEPSSGGEGDARKQRLGVELQAVEQSLSRLRLPRSALSGARDGDGVVDLETEWLELNRDVLESRERHNQLEGRYFQAAIVANVDTTGDTGPMAIVDPAFLPEAPSARGRGRVVATGVGLVLVGTWILIWVLTRADDRIIDAEQLARMNLAPLVAVVPGRRRGRIG